MFPLAAPTTTLTPVTAEPTPPSQADPRPHSAYSVLRNRDLALYLSGRFAASIGQQMLTVAVGWELYERTGSKLALAFVGLTQMIPMLLFTLPAGHVADNFARKRIILWMTAIIACASVGLALISWFEAPVFWTYFCLFVAGCGRTFLWPASSAFLPHLVSREDFPKAVNWSGGSFHLSSVAGPATGGAVIALTHHAAPVYAINALAAVLCLMLIGLIRHEHKVVLREKMTLRNLLVGFKFVFANQVVLGTITLDLFAVLLGGATALLPVYAKDILRVGPEGLGFLQAALPLGSLACAFWLAHRPPMQKAGRDLLLAVAMFGVATIVFGVSQWFWLSMAMLFACGALDHISVVVRHTLVQLLTPDAKRGRVSAVNALFIGTSNELGGFESGVVAHLLGPVFSVVSGGVGTIVVVLLVAWFWPGVRKFGRLEATEPDPGK